MQQKTQHTVTLGIRKPLPTASQPNFKSDEARKGPHKEAGENSANKAHNRETRQEAAAKRAHPEESAGETGTTPLPHPSMERTNPIWVRAKPLNDGDTRWWRSLSQ